MKKLESRTVRELIALAREWGVTGYSKLKKAELVKLLSKKQPKGGQRPATPTRAAPAMAKPTPGPTRTAAPDKAKEAGGKRAPNASSQARLARQTASRARLKQDPYSKPAVRTVAPAQDAQPESGELPERYHDGRMGLLARDPHWMYCFWDLTVQQAERLWTGTGAALRILDTTDGRARVVETILLPSGSSSWYVHVDRPDRRYVCQLGKLNASGRFLLLLASNDSTVPPAGISQQPAQRTLQTDPLSRAPEAPPSPRAAGQAQDSPQQMAERFLALSVGGGPSTGLDSAESLHLLRERVAAGLSSEVMHSIGLVTQAPAGPSAPAPGADFWLRMDADLILYGATVPGSSVTLAGVPLSLDDQGHFRARFALPDGTHAFPLSGTSPDGRFQRQIRVQVDRSSQR